MIIIAADQLLVGGYRNLDDLKRDSHGFGLRSFYCLTNWYHLL